MKAVTSQQRISTAKAPKPTSASGEKSATRTSGGRIRSPRTPSVPPPWPFVTFRRLMAERLLRTLRVRNEHRPGVLGRLAGAIGSAGANIGDIRTLWVGPEHIERDLDILVEDRAEPGRAVAQASRRRK